MTFDAEYWWPWKRKSFETIRDAIQQANLFDEVWYRSRYAIIAKDALKHYMRRGARKGYDPNPLFASQWYAASYKHVKTNPLVHFVVEGARSRLSPHPLFDTELYCRSNADVVAAGLNPLSHYLERGGLEGRDPHPLFQSQWYLDENPDVAAARVNPLVHYLEHGAAEGRDPSTEFSTDWYLARYPDVAASGLNPLVHYVLRGRDEGRTARLSKRNAELVSLSGLFDHDYYLNKNPDVAAAGVDPLQHYIDYGGSEGRRPSALFDGQRYLRNNLDVAAAGENPLVHWLRHGRNQRRSSPIKPEAVRQLSEFCNPFHLERAYVREHDPDFFVSIITPTFNTPVQYLNELFTSLLNQRYTNWEWVVVDDGSTDLDTVNILKAFADRSSRVKVAFEHHLGISGASNRALELSIGSHVALVDHDDLLSRDALLLVWQCWLEDKKCPGFYTDECKLSDNGELFDFYYKPAWSPILLENNMYLGHLTVYRRDVVLAAGGFRSEYDGTQDFDLALRVSERVDALRHISEICYFWRAVPGSTAATLTAKEYALDRQRLALLDHARKKNPRASVRPGWAIGFWHIDYPITDVHPLVSYVIPTAARSRVVRGKQVDLLTHCIASLERSKFYDNVEYVVVHNGNLTEAHLEFLGTLRRVKLVEFKSTGFLNMSRKFNFGVDNASGELICLVNDDIEIVTSEGGKQIVGFMQSNPAVGAVATLCLYENGQTQHNGMILLEGGPSHAGIYKSPEFPGHFGNLRSRREAFGVCGALMFVRRALWQDLGGWSEQFPGNFNDVDFCLRLRKAGFSCVVDPSIVAFHFEGASKTGTFPAEKGNLAIEWGQISDPYFNKNFKQSSPYFEIGAAELAEVRIDLDPDRFEHWLNERIATRAVRFQAEGRHKLTVGVPVFNQAPQLLEELAMSIAMQTYKNMEVILVDDASTDPATVAWIDNMAKTGFATVIRHDINKGITGANRSIVEAMSGSFLLLVDADDFLTVDALMVMAHHIEKHPDAKMFYSDEFNSDASSKLFNPFFKPDLDPVLITNCCYPTHLMAISRELLQSTGAYTDVKATWCHDYDSLTRAIVVGERPVHVREFLYAWRIVPGSTAAAGYTAKPQTIQSQKFVLDRLIRNLGVSQLLRVERNPLFDHEGMWRVVMHGELPTVTILKAQDVWAAEGGLDGAAVLGRAVAAASEAEWIAIVADQSPEGDVLRGLFAVSLLDKRVSVVSGIVRDAEEKGVRWAGGFFMPGGLIFDPYSGTDFSRSGYHGQLYCQRCVDVAAPMNVLIRKDILHRVLLKLGPRITSQKLVVALGLDAAANDELVCVTPHVECFVRKSWIGPFDDQGLLKEAEIGLTQSRWYNSELPKLTEAAYGIIKGNGGRPTAAGGEAER